MDWYDSARIINKEEISKMSQNYTDTNISNMILNDMTEAQFSNLQSVDPNQLYLTEDASESTTNKVTSLSSSSTDTQYPSAKCVYDLVGDVESLLNNINSGS